MFSLQRDFINNFGLYTYLEAEWLRLRVPQVFRCAQRNTTNKVSISEFSPKILESFLRFWYSFPVSLNSSDITALKKIKYANHYQYRYP